MEDQKTYYTREGLAKAKEELTQLQQEELPKASKRVAEAREKGDLKENADYHAAREQLVFLQHRIALLRDDIARSIVIDEEKINTSVVSILTKVSLKNIKDGKHVVYQIVSEKEADLKAGKVSINSPVGRGLLGKKKGETVTIQIPAGNISFEIIKIEM